MTGDQLAAILAGTNAGAPKLRGEAPASSANSAAGAYSAAEGAPNGLSATPISADTATSSSSSDDEPPILKLNGASPATIQVGSTYADLSATITGPTADLGLGLITLLDGVTTTQLTLDTSVAGTHTIDPPHPISLPSNAGTRSARTGRGPCLRGGKHSFCRAVPPPLENAQQQGSPEMPCSRGAIGRAWDVRRSGEAAGGTAAG